MARVYMTVTGRSQDTTDAIVQSGAYLGVESSNDWVAGYTPQFIDFPFTDPDATFGAHLDTVRSVAPRLAIAPDIEAGRDPAAVYEQADRLRQYADAVVVVPKTVHPSEVPDRFRVGVPLADYGSGAPWTVIDYADCSSAHLLGGGPSRQLRVRDHLPTRIASVDTATLGKRCRFGYWDGGPVDAPDEWDYRRRLREALDNYAAEWQ
jgi:hypothetical protein